MAERPDLFSRILEYLLRVILFEDCANQGSISRPMLGLILTHTKVMVIHNVCSWLPFVIFFFFCRCPFAICSFVLVNQVQYFQDLKNNILTSQPPYRRERLGNVFNKLMDDVQDNLEQKNRDKFTTNLTMFRHEVKSFVTT